MYNDAKQLIEERKQLLILTFFDSRPVAKPTSAKEGCFLSDKCPLLVKILTIGILVLPIFYRPQMIFRYFPCRNTPRLRKWSNKRKHAEYKCV